MDDLNAYGVFARVVEAGGFSAAAAALGQSKSAVSKQVSRLEERLGARLLNRTTRRLSLTEAGAAVYERCQRIVAEAEDAACIVQNLSAAPRGTLRVSAPMSFATLHLAPALPAFLAANPELRVELSLNDRFVDLIEEGFDVALRIGRLPDSSLVARRIAETRRITCAAPSYWARHGRPSVPADLAAHACLHYAYLAGGTEWRYRVDGRTVAVRVAGPVVANNGEMLLHAALAGAGVVMLPDFIVGPALADGRLEPVLEGCEEPALPIHAVYPPTRHLAAKVRAFVDFLAERFGPPAGGGITVRRPPAMHSGRESQSGSRPGPAAGGRVR